MSTMTTEPIRYDPSHPAHRVDPWPTYARLRDEAPVLHMRPDAPDGEEFYVLSRYDDVAAALRNKQVFSSQIRSGDFLDMPIMVNRDAPEHTKLRRVTNRAFGPRVLTGLTDRIQQVVDELVAEVLAETRLDFVERFSSALPLRVVGGMLGFPLDRKVQMLRWSEAVVEVFAVAAGLDPEEVPGCFEDFMGLVNFIDELSTQRVGCPHAGDILGDLVAREQAGEIDHDEVVGLGWSYIAAGQETTMNLLGGGVEMLLRDRALLELLTAEPALTEDFMEEYLRCYSPTQWALRRTLAPVELHGVTIPAGALVHIVLGAANRDPRKFTDPEIFDLRRENNDEHLAFGGGPHFCPGAVVAKLFSGMAFRSLYPHLGRFAFDPDSPPRLRSRPGTSYGIDRMGLIIKPLGSGSGTP